VSGVSISAYLSLSHSWKGLVVNWLRVHAVGYHACEWLALAMIILLSFASRIASLKFGLWLLTRKRDAHESKGETENEYWRIHGE
jgi:hypothetical protein